MSSAQQGVHFGGGRLGGREGMLRGAMTEHPMGLSRRKARRGDNSEGGRGCPCVVLETPASGTHATNYLSNSGNFIQLVDRICFCSYGRFDTLRTLRLQVVIQRIVGNFGVYLSCL